MDIANALAVSSTPLRALAKRKPSAPATPHRVLPTARHAEADAANRAIVATARDTIGRTVALLR